MLKNIINNIVRGIGTPVSLLIHTIFFVGIFALVPLGYRFEDVLLSLTTVVSLEAIYLAIFLQYTVNQNTEELRRVREDVEEIQEDVEGIQEEIDEVRPD